jgi:hypothetical protein
MSRLFLIWVYAALELCLLSSPIARAAEFTIYNVYRGLSLGNPDEIVQKDFYVNMGTLNGIREGSILEVMRKVSSFNLLNEQLYKDVVFPIARIKVIHVEAAVAVARLEKMLPAENTPAVTPRAIMVGDVVRVPVK